MRRKIILRLSLLTVFLTLLWSCRNEDLAKGETDPQRNNANFFKHISSGTAKSGVDYINILEEYNREKDFLTTMPDQKGMPMWDNMQVVNTENATGLMIPLSDDNKSMSSILFAILDDGNKVTGIRDFDNRLLENIVHNEKIDKNFREKMLYTFMYMDHKTFGNEDFTNIPAGLFDDLKYNKTYGRIKIKNFEEPQNSVLGNTGKIIWTQMCSMVWSCSHHSEGTCDYCMQLCHKKVCGDFMVFIGSDTDYPMPPVSGDGGGGATPSPDGIPPKDTCIQSGMPFYRLASQCVGNGGVDITDEDLLPPKTNCETLQQLNQQSNVVDSIAFLKTKTTGKQEFAIEIERNGTTFKTKLKIGTEFGTIVQTAGHIKGQAHNHPATGQSIPSFGDIKWLRDCKMNIAPSIANAYSIIVCYDPANPTNTNEDIVYAIMIDDYDALNTKVNDLWNRPDLLNKNDDERLKKLNDEISKDFAEVQFNSSGMEKRFLEKFNDFGISLYRQDKNTKSWDKLSLENNTINKIPCP